MASRTYIPPNTDTVLLFGSQALSFDQQSFRNLSSTVLNSASHGWVLRAIDDLADQWQSICSKLPKLRTASGASQLPKLGDWFRTGTLDASLPNMLLSPLVVIAQLTQYAEYVESREPESLPPSETVGFCTYPHGIVCVCSINAPMRSIISVTLRKRNYNMQRTT